MSEARGQQQQEPSMEEILASIRRIISEDGTAPQGGATTEESAEPAAASDQAAAPEAASLDRHAAPDESAEGDDALLLTEMVADDGTVVSLAGRTDDPEAPIEPAAEPALPEPPVLEPDPAPRAEVEPEPAPELPQRESGREPELGVSDLEPEAEPAAEVPVGVKDAPEPAAEPRTERMEPAMPTAARQPEMAEDPSQSLISDATFVASTAALSQLSRTVRRDKDFPLGGGRMVEDLVREALEPMLREWLDANLQGIVERLVRQEIERMVRRAEEES